MRPHIAAFLDMNDPFLLPQRYREDCYLLVAKDTLLFTFAQSYFSRDKLLDILMYSSDGHCFSEKEILYSDELLQKFRLNHITHFIIPAQCSKILHEWAKKYSIVLIGTPYYLQKKLENKIYFDALLKQNNLSSPHTIDVSNISSNKMRYVIQKSASSGLTGTHFVNSLDELLKIKENTKKKLLIREYLEGISIGASILIDKDGEYFFSAFRRQCFFNKNDFPNFFLGIQWLPTAFFSREITASIYLLLSQLADVLIAKRFTGMANIDILIHNGVPYIIECNPRLSAASIQLFSVSQLSGFTDPYGFFLNIFLNKKNITVPTTIPHSSYKGCLLSVDVSEPLRVTNILPIGVYELRKNFVVYVGSNMKYLDKRARFLMLHDLQKNEYLSKNATLCTIIADTPLFDLMSGKLNTKGELLYTFFYNEFINRT